MEINTVTPSIKAHYLTFWPLKALFCWGILPKVT